MIHIPRFTFLSLKCSLSLNPMAFYAVARGKRPGIYYSWRECEANVNGFRGAVYKKFLCECDAVSYLEKLGVKSTCSGQFCKAANDDSDMVLVEVPPHRRILPCEINLENMSGNVTSTPKASESNMDNSNHSFDFASFAQRLTNLENLYQLKIQALEERVEALEGAKALVESEDFDDNNCDNTSVCTMDPAPGASTAVSNTKAGLLSNAPPNPMSTLRRKFHALASNPTPLGRKSISIRGNTRKRAGKISSFYEEPPYKIPAVQPLDSSLAELNKSNGVPFHVDSEGYIEVYTDGACANNGGSKPKAGIGVWFNDGHPLNISEPVNGRPTNNTAEIQAVTRAVERAALHGIKKLSVITDSNYTIKCLNEWMPRWKMNNWRTCKGEAVKNQKDLLELDRACNQLGILVKWTHVLGHSGVHGNECADRLARVGAENCPVEMTLWA